MRTVNKKVIAIASADWHLHRFRNFDVNGSRLNWGILAAQQIMNEAYIRRVPLLFTGDLIHTPKEIETETNAKVQKLFSEMRCWMISIPGNHDMSDKNSLSHRSPTHLDALPNRIIQLDEKVSGYRIEGTTLTVWGIPYMNNDLDLKKSIEYLRKSTKSYVGVKILMLHTDIPGAKTPEGFTIGETEHIPRHLDKFFKEWDLVLCGHIHKPQKLSEKVYMLGCPIPQDAGNQGDFGYWKVYSDKSMEFIPMNNFPKFIRLKKGEVAPTNTIDYYIAYNEILVDEEVQQGEFNITTSKSKLAKRYLAKKNIKSKLKRRALIKILNTQ